MADLASCLHHTAPSRVAWLDLPLGRPGPGEVLVRTQVSALSSGTEGLFFRGLVAEDTVLDASLAGLAGQARYPFRYGYCLCGEVEARGPGDEGPAPGTTVFCFEPHATAVVVPATRVQAVPDGVAPHRAVLFPLLETAVTLVLDARPRWGDRVAVFGLGTLGLITARLLADFPVSVDVFDPIALRRERAAAWAGVQTPAEPRADYDLAFDLGGAPSSLAAAVRSLGFGARLVLGSWQGRDLVLPGAGPEFHRKRLEVVTSQVSTLAPGLSARWNVERRSRATWERLRDLPLEDLVTHRLPHRDAQAAFELATANRDSVQQVVLTYE